MIVLAVVVFHVLGFLSSIHAIMSTRTEQGAVAWAVSLNTFPYVAVPAYWVLGRSRFQGYVDCAAGRDGGDRRFDRRRPRLRFASSSCRPRVSARQPARPRLWPESPPSAATRSSSWSTATPPSRASSRASIAAEDYVLFQFFIVHDDEIGRDVKTHLIERAKAGVRVYFLYDEVGSHDLPRSYKDELREAGVEVFDFHTQKGPGNRFQLNFRNHRKVVVVDGKVAWVGGHNVGDEYLGRDPKFGHWRDTHVRIEGPAALGAQLSFAEDWYWATGRRLDVSWHPVSADGADVPVLIIPSGPADELETANLMFVHAINTATERIWIASPYFVPDRPVITALQLAGLRGVDVRILIPDEPDHLGVYLAAFAYLDESESTGVRFYRYQDGFLHQKVMLIDRSFATIGTANFDNRSFRLNFEITAVVADTGFAAEVERMLETDFSKSRLMEPGEYDRKPWWFRFAVKLARLTAPIQ